MAAPLNDNTNGSISADINREIQHESKHAHAPRVHGTRAHVTPCRNVSSSVNTLLQPSLVGALDLFWMPNVAPGLLELPGMERQNSDAAHNRAVRQDT